MSKRFLWAFILSLCLTFFFGVGISQAYYDTNVSVKVNGTAVNFPDQAPYIDSEAGRTFVPISFVAEKMGCNVTWDDNSKLATIIKGSKVVKIHVNDTTAIINDKRVTLDSPARITEGRTMVPLGFIGEAFDCTVSWNPDSRTVVILTTGKTPPGWVEPDIAAYPWWAEHSWTLMVNDNDYKDMEFKVELLDYADELNNLWRYSFFREKWWKDKTADGEWRKLGVGPIVQIYDTSETADYIKYANDFNPKGKTIWMVVSVRLGDFVKEYPFKAEL